jgi:hypothetical protein
MSYIGKKSRIRNSGTIGVTMMKCKLSLCNLTQKNFMESPKFLYETVYKKIPENRYMHNVCPIVNNPRARNSGTIGVTIMKCELDV